jgi:hypothetical protein
MIMKVVMVIMVMVMVMVMSITIMIIIVKLRKLYFDLQDLSFYNNEYED